jgi:hypothetical protein
MNRSACAVAIMCMAACASAPGSSTAPRTAESEVSLAQRERFEAMLKQNAVLLATLLDDDLTYVHNPTGVSSFWIRFTEVYIRRDRRWLLTAWQATRIAE